MRIDNTLVLARLIVRGIYEQFPTLKLIGTDSPMLLSLRQNGRDAIEKAGFRAAEKAAVLGGTARRLLEL